MGRKILFQRIKMLISKKLYLSLIIAITLLQSCSILVENPTDALLRKAKDLEYAGQFTEAEDAYNKVYDLNREASPVQLSILLNKARLYLRTKNYTKVIHTCEEGLKVCRSIFGPKDMLNASFLFVLGSAYDNAEEYGKAISTFKSIMTFASYSSCSRDLVNIMPLIKLGDIEFKKNNLQKAIKYYREAYAIGQLSETMRRVISYRLALCFMTLKHNGEAELYFQNALPSEPTQSAPNDIYVKYAKFLAKTGKFAGAGLAMRQSEKWYSRHKEYLDWYYQRTRPGSRCRLVDIFTERDYNLVEAIQQSAAKKNPAIQLSKEHSKSIKKID